VPSRNEHAIASPAVENSRHERLKRRIAVEEYFARSGRTFRKSRGRLWYERNIKTPALKAGIKGLGVYARGVKNALSPRVRQLKLSFDDLPSGFDRFTILHMADLHIDKMDGLAEALAPVLSRLQCDACVLTGDYRFDFGGSCAQVYPRIEAVVSSISAPYGIFGILGNHDAAEMAPRLEAMGVRMLINEAVAIEKGDSALWLAGIDDSFDYRCHDLPQALASVPPESFKILLAHSPELYQQASDQGVALYLCGHTHAGQIRLPVVGALKKNARCPRAYIQGQWVHKGMQGYTTWGAGCSGLPVRFNCPPEVALIELRKA